MASVYLISVIFAISFILASSKNSEEDIELVRRSLIDHFYTKTPPSHLAPKSYQLTHLFRDGKEKTFNNGLICLACNLAVFFVIVERKLGISRNILAKEASLLCVHLGIENQRVCDGVIDQNLDIFLYIMDNHPDFTSQKVCGSLLQNFGCRTGDAFEWSINIPSGNSANRPKTNSIDVPFIKILQLSDIHYDPNYKPNGNADCGEPLCCQGDQGEPTSLENSCGFWTDYRDADVPWHLIEETIRQVKTQEFDYVYYNGDIISHRVWESSIEINTETISRLYSFFKESFDVPVYPVFGNHEPHPLNVWPTKAIEDKYFSMKWLFELAAKSWSELVGEDISETVLKGGYYTVSPKPGFRIIAINSNLCYTYNWWLLFDDVDPYGQLQWLADTLKEAEDNNESVHILSHVPTGNPSSLKVWGREYSKIVERFSNTITGQFNGHTHKDEFQVYYNSSNPTQPVGVIFNGASITPFSNSNPSYKLYQVEPSTFSLLDYEEWTFNLTLANSQPSTPPEWYKLYSFVEAYGVENLSPVEVDGVLYKMAANHSLLDEYFKFGFRNGDAGIKTGCDTNCQRSNLCEIATTIYGDDTQCKRFLELYDN